MPRPPQTWTEPQAGNLRTDWLPQMDRVEYCACPYPCTEATCLRHLGGCVACEKHGQALYTRAEERWIADPNTGLTADEAQALRNLWGRHDNHNSRLVREGGPAYGAGAKPSEPVAEAC